MHWEDKIYTEFKSCIKITYNITISMIVTIYGTEKIQKFSKPNEHQIVNEEHL